jgi:hypothetical protein
MIKMSQRNIVFLLGAGASKGIGLPTSTELLANIREWAKQGTTPYASQIIEAAIEAYEHYNDYLNFEDLLTALNSLVHREDTELWPFVATLREPFERILRSQPELFSSLYEDMWKYVRSQLVIKYSESQEWSYLKNLVRMATESATPAIFTLNYDLSLEAVMEAESIKYSTGFMWAEKMMAALGMSSNFQWWLLGIGWMQASNADRFSQASDGQKADIRLIKVHGSLDWFRVAGSALYTVEGIQVFPEDPIVRSSSTPSSAIEEIMIAGRVGKQRLEEPFATLLREFYDAVLKADGLVIIGYSFSDEHINRILIESRLRLREYDIIVINGPNWAVGVDSLGHLSNEAQKTWAILDHSYDMLTEYGGVDMYVLPYYAEEAINEGHLRRAIEKNW